MFPYSCLYRIKIVTKYLDPNGKRVKPKVLGFFFIFPANIMTKCFYTIYFLLLPPSLQMLHVLTWSEKLMHMYRLRTTSCTYQKKNKLKCNYRLKRSKLSLVFMQAYLHLDIVCLVCPTQRSLLP